MGGFLYVAIGVAYNYKFKGQTGVEMVPNIEFWRSLPGLLKVRPARLSTRRAGAPVLNRTSRAECARTHRGGGISGWLRLHRPEDPGPL